MGLPPILCGDQSRRKAGRAGGVGFNRRRHFAGARETEGARVSRARPRAVHSVSVSRGQYDAEIYTNNKSELGRDLSRDVTQHTAIPSHRQDVAKIAM